MADRNDPRALNGSAFVQYLDGVLSSETTSEGETFRVVYTESNPDYSPV